MARAKRRHGFIGLPPRIDAPIEDVMRAFFAASPDTPFTAREYHCVECGRQVNFPYTLHSDGKCSTCHEE